MASHRSPHPSYQRHQPEQTALYAIVEQRLPKLCAGLAERDASLPAFVTREFRDYLRCGLLEYGFIRVKCNGCRHEHLAWPAARLFLQAPRVCRGRPAPPAAPGA